ncbi:MAG: serine hydrolase [Chloroflexi bacterium]|nr:serine hydrolase [Chloroflexota bacterium]
MDTLVRERDGMRLWFNRTYTDQTAPTGIIGPVSDHARLMIAYLNEEKLDGQRILQPPHGLGWLVHTNEQGQRWLSHGGGGPGFGTDMRLYPDESLGIVVIGNDTTYDKSAIFDLVTILDW